MIYQYYLPLDMEVRKGYLRAKGKEKFE